MEILIKFFLKKNDSDKLLFWSCILDTDVNLSQEDIVHMNRDNEISLCNYTDIKIVTEYSIANIEQLPLEYKNYKKRPAVFLNKDKIYLTGSPYTYCCSELTNYYLINENFQIELLKFLKNLSNYDFNMIQREIIANIKFIIGIDIIKQESIPGCLSIYKKLPNFKINGNYNPKQGKRYLEIITPNIESDYLAEIELTDSKKILFKQVYCFNSNYYRIDFPDENELEPFSQLHITIYEKNTDCFKRQYEECLSLIRSFNIGLSVIEGNSKLLRNRFLDNRVDLIPNLTYTVISENDDTDWIDWEQNYKKSIFGKPKEFLESHFFSSDEAGREKFLNWARNKLEKSITVIIIDPFFDLQGLRDFSSCCAGNCNLEILTTDPKDTPCDTKENGYLLKEIYHCFPKAKVYFLERKILHDRYTIFEMEDETLYFSLSNSWNGTVNNYSLFIQEIGILETLKIKDCYRQYFDEKFLQQNLQPNKKKGKKTLQRKTCKKKDIGKIIKNIYHTENAEFKQLCSDLFSSEIEDYEAISMCIEKIPYVHDIDEFISDICISLLKYQKERFADTNHYIRNKSIAEYTNATDCIERVKLRAFCGYPPYELEIDYVLFKLLEVCFAVFPSKVIKELEKQEKAICIIDALKDEKINHYTPSELIISSMLSEIYCYIDYKDIVKLIDFALKTESLYCQIYIIEWIISNTDLKFCELIETITKINPSENDLLIILIHLYNQKELDKRNINTTNQYLLEIQDYVSTRFAHNKEMLLKFAINTYILSHDLRIDNLTTFIKKNAIIEDELNKFILLYSVYNIPNKKFYNHIKEYCNIDKYILSLLPEEKKKKQNIIGIGKFINYIPLLGHILAKQIKNYPKVFTKLIYKLNFIKPLIFETFDYKEPLDFDYYILNIILYAFYEIKNDTPEVNNEIKNIDWYIPCLLNTVPFDFYGLSYYMIDIYLSFKSDAEKIQFLNLIHNPVLKTFIASRIQDRFFNNSYPYVKILTNYEIEKNDNAKSIIFLINIFINLVFTSTPSTTSLDSLIDIQKKLSKNNNEKINLLTESGIGYFKDKNNNDKKKNFINTMEQIYYPHSARRYEDEIND